MLTHYLIQWIQGRPRKLGKRLLRAEPNPTASLVEPRIIIIGQNRTDRQVNSPYDGKEGVNTRGHRTSIQCDETTLYLTKQQHGFHLHQR